MKNCKKISFVLSLALIFGLMGNVKAHAGEWSMTFPTLKMAKTDWDNYEYYGGGNAYISLTRIVEGPSYYCRAQSVNSNNEARSSYELCLQGDGYNTLDNVSMSTGHEYYVRAYNDYFETSYRWAYGDFSF
ncbi:hypothetical protein SDC9_41635 [bioreactor metagenome]|jgi:hypothetical protein|uniref:Uncharacterized protein n=1 Tax=bioreactor metagenome TaxID=1076179 RepID=A0A644VVJ5_9ZZZZ